MLYLLHVCHCSQIRPAWALPRSSACRFLRLFQWVGSGFHQLLTGLQGNRAPYSTSALLRLSSTHKRYSRIIYTHRSKNHIVFFSPRSCDWFSCNNLLILGHKDPWQELGAPLAACRVCHFVKPLLHGLSEEPSSRAWEARARVTRVPSRLLQ